MSTQLPHTSYNPEFAKRVVSLIEARSDSLVLQELKGAPSIIRAEAIREFLWRQDIAGGKVAQELLQQYELEPRELRTVFAAAAECGNTKILRLICRTAPEAIDSTLIRIGLLGALHKAEFKCIRWIADTVLLSPEVKYRAITPSLFKSSDESRFDRRARDELGAAEIVITKQFRDMQNELRREQREQRLSQQSPSEEEKRALKIERTFSELLRNATNRIRHHRQKQAEPLFGHELREHCEITTLLIEQVTREIDRQREVAISSPASTDQERSTRIGDVPKWRGTNPKGHEESPSFAEMLEDFFRDNRDKTTVGTTLFSDFIDSVLYRWKTNKHPLSRESLCKLIEEKHPRNETLSNSVFYSWKNHPEYTPTTESLTTIAEAFQLNKFHEHVMFRLAKGHPCHNLESLVSASEQSLKTPNEARTRGELFTALCDASGIPVIVLSKTLAVQQVALWKRGQRIKDPEMASRFVNLVNPLAIYPKEERDGVRALNARIKTVLGGRVASVFDAVFLAERSRVANPGGLLFSLLIGCRGVAPLDLDAAVKLLNVSPSKLKHMASSSDRRGGEITETMASTVLDYVQGVTEATRHLLSPIQRAEREVALDTLTRIPSPVRLMVQLQRGELSHVGEVHRLTRLRRGLPQKAGMSDFELGKASIFHARASEIADWLGFTGPRHRECRRLFITKATGTYISESPSQILDEIISGKLQRHLGVQKLFDWTGLTRRELNDKIGGPKSRISSYTTAGRQGQISNTQRLLILADEFGLRHRFDELVAVFKPKTYIPVAPHNNRSEE